MAVNLTYEQKVATRLDDISDWAILGWSYSQMAKELGIAVSTFCSYVHDNNKKGLQKALSCERIRNSNVVDSLYSAAIGYWKVAPKAIKIKKVTYDAGGHRNEIEEIQMVDELTWYPADTRAIIYYLNNRDSMNWKDKIVDTGVVPELLDKAGKLVLEIKQKADAMVGGKSAASTSNE